MTSPATTGRRSAEDQILFENMLRDIFEQCLPFNKVVGLRIDSLAPDSPRLVFDMRPELAGSHLHYRLHGGVIATALDTVGGFAVALGTAEKHADETPEQLLMRFARFGTIDMRIDYLNQGIGHRFIACARVIRLGGRIATAHMELRNEADVLIATGTAAYIVS